MQYIMVKSFIYNFHTDYQLQYYFIKLYTMLLASVTIMSMKIEYVNFSQFIYTLILTHAYT